MLSILTVRTKTNVIFPISFGRCRRFGTRSPKVLVLCFSDGSRSRIRFACTQGDGEFNQLRIGVAFAIPGRLHCQDDHGINAKLLCRESVLTGQTVAIKNYPHPAQGYSVRTWRVRNTLRVFFHNC